jgi:hypothetical protein
MEGQLHGTREAWLNYVADRMAPMFENSGAPLPAQLQFLAISLHALNCVSVRSQPQFPGQLW